MRGVLMLIGSLIGAIVYAQPTYHTFDLTPWASLDIRTLTNGNAYPTGNRTLTAGGVPMYVAASPQNPNTLIVVYVGADNQLRTFDIPINLRGARRVYTLINNLWGQCGLTLGKVEVFGSNGSYAVMNLVEGVNVRDHYNGYFCNSLTDPTVLTLEFGAGVRLDRQVIELPSSFLNDTVEFVRFSGRGQYPQGAVFLAALTVEVCATANGDVNRDGCVNDTDLLQVLFNFGTTGANPADVNCDSVVNDTDLLTVLFNFGQGC